MFVNLWALPKPLWRLALTLVFCIGGTVRADEHDDELTRSPDSAESAPAPADSAPSGEPKTEGSLAQQPDQPSVPGAPPPGAAQSTAVESANAAPQPFVLDRELPPPRTRRTRRRGSRGKGLLIGGIGAFVGSYLFSTLVGLTLLSNESDDSGVTTCTNCDKGKLLAIPLVGPWLMYPHADGTDGKAVSAFLGVAQAVGFAIMVGGIAKYVSSRRGYASAAGLPSLAVSIAPHRHGAHALVRVRL